MRIQLRAVFLVGLSLLVILAPPYEVGAQPQGGPTVALTSQYIVNPYGFAVINETARFNNTGSSPVQMPALQLGIPRNISSRLLGNYTLTEGFTLTTSNSSGLLVFNIVSQNSLQPKEARTLSLKAVVGDISVVNSSATSVVILGYPSVNLQVNTLSASVQMPASTLISTPPQGWTSNESLGRTVYRRSFTDFAPTDPQVFLGKLQGSGMDFHPIHAYAASRTLTAASNGSPLVQDTLTVKNTGSSDLTSLRLALVNTSGRVTIVPPGTPPLVNPTPLTLSGGVLDLTRNPFVAVPTGRNLTVAILYALPANSYRVSGDSVRIDLPLTPPILAPVDTFTLSISLPAGLRATEAHPRVVEFATPITSGKQTFQYSLTLGWASDRAIPVASLIFGVALLAFFVSVERPSEAGKEEEEEEEGGVTGDISDMIKAFEEKVDLVNTILQEVPKEDPASLNKAYFDEQRSRIDDFRSRAIQRLNEVKQKLAGQRFSEQLTRINDIERGADRATKDILNLHEQYYTKRMRQETFEKLLPSYRKRLDAAMNQLSDQLNLARRESKSL